MQSFLKTGKLGPSTASAKDVKAGSSKQRKRGALAPWVEKYRPKTVEEVVEQNDVVAVLKECINGSDLPHLLFYGPPGTGKTSTILAAAKQLFGDIYKERILELNASDERGIQVIRVKVKNFASLTASGIRPDGRPCPAFKIIILDEADSMTHDAQAALRRTMERETKSTRFCLICNYVSRIIDPLTSRCTKFRFKPLAKEMVFERLKFICHEENVNCTTKAMECLVETSGGDMRRAITSLQSCARLKGKGADIEEKDVLEATGVIPPSLMNGLLEVCALNDYAPLHKYVVNFIKEAYSAFQLFNQLNEMIILNESLQDKQKSVICEKLADCSYRAQDGGSEYLQMMDLGCTIINALQM